MEHPLIPARYDRQTVWLHWASAVLVGLLWVSAQCIDLFPKGPSRWNVLGLHMTMGMVLAVFVAMRLRAKRPALPRSGAARAGHRLLYAMLVLAILAGLANAWIRGEHVFNLFQLAAPDPANKPLRAFAGKTHLYLANTLLLLAIGHACIALWHQFILRDGLLGRMVPRSGAGR